MRPIPLLAILLMTLSASSALGANPATRPNIVYIIADDLGYADIGAQGLSKDVKTPNLDSIAKSGARFTSAYVSCPVCSPTRAGLMTGRYQQRFGHEFNPGPAPSEIFGLPTSETTLAQALKSAGYKTGMVGKWHLGNRPELVPTARGFDEFFGFLAGAHSYTKDDNARNRIMRGTEPVEEKEYLTDAFNREAVAFIERSHSGPFFLYLAYNAIHTPMEATEKYLSRFPNVTDEKRRTMLAMLSALDDGVGQLLEILRKHNLEENTLIIFHTDNGGPTQANGSLNNPLSGIKGQVWEGGIRIPFLVQWKSKIQPGQVIDQPVIALDVFPTACAVASAAPPSTNKLDGIDLLPLLTGRVDAPKHDSLFWRFGQQAAIRHNNYKLVRFEGHPDKLFDLSSDPAEKDDLAGSKPDVAKDLAERYDHWNSELVKPLWNNARTRPISDDVLKQQQRQPRAGGGARARRRQGSPASQPAN